MKSRIILTTIIMGASGIISQIILLRELLITFYGNEFSIGIIMGNWLIAEAAGAFLIGRLIKNTRNTLETYILYHIMFAISFVLAIYLCRILKIVMGVPQGESLGLIPMIFGSMLVLGPVGFFHGALFTIICPILHNLNKSKDGSVSIGKAYIYETLGTIVGSVLVTFVLISVLNSIEIAFAVAFVNFMINLILLEKFWRRSLIQTHIAGLCSTIFFVISGLFLALRWTDSIQEKTIKKQWSGFSLIYYKNSIYNNVAVTEQTNQYTIYIDGLPTVSIPVPDIAYIEEFVHIPMLHHPTPKQILVISGGAGGVIAEILKHPVERIDYVELDPLILEVIKKFPTPITDYELTSPRIKLYHQDGRYFLQKMKCSNYDLIFIGLQNPRDLQTNRFFTAEFFSLIKQRLKQSGILVLHLSGSLTYLGKELRNLNRCIYNTLNLEFACVKVIPGDCFNILLASQSDRVLKITPEEISNQLQQRNLRLNLISPYYLEYKLNTRLENWFYESIKNSTTSHNHDFRPLGLYYSLSYQNIIFSHHLRVIFNFFEKINLKKIWILLIIISILFTILILKSKKLSCVAIPLCIFTTGFTGMIFDLVLLFAFQTIYGYVFHWAGILVASFMVGTIFGAQISSYTINKTKHWLSLFWKIDFLVILYSIVFPIILIKGGTSISNPAGFLFLSFICGICIGVEFPIANAIYLSVYPTRKYLSETAGLLYSSDLIGGWLGGILGGVILLPLFGLSGTFETVFSLKLATFIVLIIFVYKNRAQSILH